MKYKFIDLFCGLGGFRIGFERNGYDCVFSSDFDKNIQLTYKENFGEEPFGDITKIDPKKMPDFDVLVGGFPCQPFSVSGKKKGFADTRGTLFFDVCRIIKEKIDKLIEDKILSKGDCDKEVFESHACSLKRSQDAFKT